MEININQKQFLLDLLLAKQKEELRTINKLSQTVSHNENWAIPIAEKTNETNIIHSMSDIVTWAKRDIKNSQKKLEDINDLIEKIKNLDGS